MRSDELRVSVLGPVRAWLGDAEPALGPARRRTVFALLAGRANQVVSRDELVDGVWGDSPPAGAVGSLHTYVSGLRSALGPARDALVSGSGGYSLRLADAALDAKVFQRGCAEAQRLLAIGDWSGARAAVDEVLGLWHGAAYGGSTGPFAEQERRRLGELRLSAVELRCRAALELGQHAEVVAEVTALLGEHPWHESLRALLMLALHRAGRNGEALAVFRGAHQALVEHQGIEPGTALRDAYRLILADLAPRRVAVPAERSSA